MLCEVPGWEDLLGWFMASRVPDVLATGGGGVVVRGSAESKGVGMQERVSPRVLYLVSYWTLLPSLALFWVYKPIRAALTTAESLLWPVCV